MHKLHDLTQTACMLSSARYTVSKVQGVDFPHCRDKGVKMACKLLGPSIPQAGPAGPYCSGCCMAAWDSGCRWQSPTGLLKHKAGSIAALLSPPPFDCEAGSAHDVTLVAAGKLIIISNNCPPIRKAEVEYYAMLSKTGVHHYGGSESPSPFLAYLHLTLLLLLHG